jgi:hypothetical protein
VKRRHTIGAIAVLLVFHGCGNTFRVVQFEVLEPASRSLPEEVNQLLVLNRAPFTFDAFEEEDRRGLDPQGLMIVDTLIVNNLFRGLLHVLETSPIEKFHYPSWSSERRRDTADLRDLVLTRKEVDELCEEFIVNAILSLEFYSMDIDQFHTYYEDGGTKTKYYELSSKVIWNVYIKGYPKPFDEYTLIDTLYFTEVLDGELYGFYSTAGMIRESFFKSGMKYGRYLVPVWIPAARTIYRGGEKMLRIAAKETAEGDWDSAFSIWKGLSAGEDSTIVAKSFHNMAVYFELEDNLDSASALVNRALRYDSLELIKDYQEELEMRLENKKELYKQVSK